MRTLFDGVVAAYPSMKSHLKFTSDVVHSPNFESGVTKIQNGRESTLTAQEKAAVRPLLKNQEDEEDVADASFVAKIFNANASAKSKYIDCSFIPPGSVMVESLFSKAGHMFDDRRLATTPVHVEQQVFLRVFLSVRFCSITFFFRFHWHPLIDEENRDYWDALTLPNYIDARVIQPQSVDADSESSED